MPKLVIYHFPANKGAQMAQGRKTGGRVIGTPNRRTQDIQAMLNALGCNPIEGMARLAMDKNTPIEIQARMYAELAQYIAPKRRAAEVHTNAESRVVFNIGIPRRDTYAKLITSDQLAEDVQTS